MIHGFMGNTISREILQREGEYGVRSEAGKPAADSGVPAQGLDEPRRSDSRSCRKNNGIPIVLSILFILKIALPSRKKCKIQDD